MLFYIKYIKMIAKNWSLYYSLARVSKINSNFYLKVKDKGIKCQIIGAGSNLLINDSGLKGLTISGVFKALASSISA